MWAAKVTITGHTATGTTDLKVAQAALNQIIGKFELLSDFENVFSTSNRNNKEIIFTLHFADGEATNWAGQFYIRMQYLSDRCMDVTASG